MVQTIIAVDNQDEDLGYFFAECLRHIECFSDNNSLDIIKSNALNDLIISLKISNTTNFIFLAFSHGTNKALLKNGITPYISTTLNTDKFKESFFYSCACHTGKELGKTLIDKGCASFIGYNKEFSVWLYDIKPFIKCATYGYKLFLEGHQIEDIKNNMIEKYNEYIFNDEILYFTRANLRENRNALVAHGNMKHSIKDLE